MSTLTSIISFPIFSMTASTGFDKTPNLSCCLINFIIFHWFFPLKTTTLCMLKNAVASNSDHVSTLSWTNPSTKSGLLCHHNLHAYWYGGIYCRMNNKPRLFRPAGSNISWGEIWFIHCFKFICRPFRKYIIINTVCFLFNIQVLQV